MVPYTFLVHSRELTNYLLVFLHSFKCPIYIPLNVSLFLYLNFLCILITLMVIMFSTMFMSCALKMFTFQSDSFVASPKMLGFVNTLTQYHIVKYLK